MNDTVKVIVDEHKRWLRSEQTSLVDEQMALNNELVVLVDDINNYVNSVVSVWVTPTVSIGVCNINTVFVPGVIIDWVDNKITFRLSVAIGHAPPVDYYDQIDMKEEHVARYVAYEVKRVELDNALESVVYQLATIHEKELQLKGNITIELLMEIGLEYLLCNEKVRRTMGLTVIDSGIVPPTI